MGKFATALLGTACFCAGAGATDLNRRYVDSLDVMEGGRYANHEVDIPFIRSTGIDTDYHTTKVSVKNLLWNDITVTDTDRDGIPNTYEVKRGLIPWILNGFDRSDTIDLDASGAETEYPGIVSNSRAIMKDAADRFGLAHLR